MPAQGKHIARRFLEMEEICKYSPALVGMTGRSAVHRLHLSVPEDLMAYFAKKQKTDFHIKRARQEVWHWI